MKNIVLTFLCLLLIAGNAAGQELNDILAQETCDCMSEKNVDGMSEEQIQMEFSLCIMTSMGNHQAELEKMDLDLPDQAAITRLGEQIGLKMATKCPALLMKMGAMQTEQAQKQMKTVSEMEGAIKRIEGEEFSFIVLADDQGREHRFLWLRYFPGSEKLINDMDGALGKKVKIQYSSMECFSPKIKDYYDRREITAIQFL